jgi:hypothetical protein
MILCRCRERSYSHFAWNEDATEMLGLSEIGLTTIGALQMNRVQLVKARGMWASVGEHPPPG